MITRIAIVGAGPRGLTVMERLVAHAGSATLEIHVIDPCPAGSGAVWRTDQSRHLLMNTLLTEQTVFPDASVPVDHQGTGPTMAEWAAGVREGTYPASEEVRELIAATPEPGFPRRILYGAYLRFAFGHVIARAPESVTVVEHRARVATVLDPPRDNPSGITTQLLRLDDGTDLEADAVVLALGHIPSGLNPARLAWERHAERHGLGYVPPGLPADVDLDALVPAGSTAIFRGFGLNFFDHMTRLTSGRGGRFVSAPDDAFGPLAYESSGREPVLVPGSRRGVPYRAKPYTPGTPAPKATLRYATAERMAGKAEVLHFNRDIWPSVLADVRYAYYETLARTRPEAFAGGTADPALKALESATGSDWEGVLAEVVPNQADHLDLHRLLNPLQDRGFPSYQELHAWMLGFLANDARQARLGIDSPIKNVTLVLTAARLEIKKLVVAGRIDPASVHLELRGWFEDFAAGICDGPPVQRTEELLALAKAGLVRFAGPDMRIEAPDGAFAVSSPALALPPVRAGVLVDACSPLNRVAEAADVLLAGMMERGQLRARVTETPLAGSVVGSGLDVTAAPYRTLNSRGQAHPHRYVLGLQLSSVQWGLAIAAQPGTSPQSIADADAIARAILGG